MRHALAMEGFAGSNAWNAATIAPENRAGVLSVTVLTGAPVHDDPTHTLMCIPGGFVVNNTVVSGSTVMDADSLSSRRSTVPGGGVGVGLAQVTVRQGLG